MTKVIFNNEEIDLIDKLDPGEEELDLNIDSTIDLEDTLIIDLNEDKNE